MKKIAVAFCAVGMILTSLVTFVGCETSEDVANSLQVSPSEVSLDQYPQSVTLTVGGTSGSVSTNDTLKTSAATDLGALALPLTWAVSNPNIGNIAHSSGNQAVYQRTRGDGINIITCKDQYGLTGIATVKQETQGSDESTDTTLTLSASPLSIPKGQNQTTISVISSGSAPYTWTVLSGSGSFVGDTSARQVTYQTDGSVADSTLQATDSGGRKGQITVKQL
jgi:hypothetical protein